MIKREIGKIGFINVAGMCRYGFVDLHPCEKEVPTKQGLTEVVKTKKSAKDTGGP
jgi:hypothetical protein